MILCNSFRVKERLKERMHIFYVCVFWLRIIVSLQYNNKTCNSSDAIDLAAHWLLESALRIEMDLLWIYCNISKECLRKMSMEARSARQRERRNCAKGVIETINRIVVYTYAGKRYQTNLRIHEILSWMMRERWESVARLKQRNSKLVLSLVAWLSLVRCNIIRENDENPD